jgi:hypothetical protein
MVYLCQIFLGSLPVFGLWSFAIARSIDFAAELINPGSKILYYSTGAGRRTAKPFPCDMRGTDAVAPGGIASHVDGQRDNGLLIRSEVAGWELFHQILLSFRSRRPGFHSSFFFFSLALVCHLQTTGPPPPSPPTYHNEKRFTIPPPTRHPRCCAMVTLLAASWFGDRLCWASEDHATPASFSSRQSSKLLATGLFHQRTSVSEYRRVFFQQVRSIQPSKAKNLQRFQLRSKYLFSPAQKVYAKLTILVKLHWMIRNIGPRSCP